MSNFLLVFGCLSLLDKSLGFGSMVFRFQLVMITGDNFKKKSLNSKKKSWLNTITLKYLKKDLNFGRKQIFDKFLELGAPERSLNRWLALLE